MPRGTRVLLVPLERIGDDYPMSREKLCPVLGFYEAATREAALTACRAMVRRQGAGHSAAIHASDPAIILRFGAEMNVLRVAVNVGCSTGRGRLRHVPRADHDDRHRLSSAARRSARISGRSTSSSGRRIAYGKDRRPFGDPSTG